MKNFPTGIKDLDREILSKLPDEDVIKSCSVNKYLRDKVCDESFFERRMRENYPKLYPIINEEVFRGEIKNYKQAYLETIYYISKMKEIGYNYVDNRNIPKDQYRESEEIYEKFHGLKKHATHKIKYTLLLRDVINTEDLDLIKYVMSLYNFDVNEQKTALSNSHIWRPDIIKYFSDRGGASPAMISTALVNSRKNGNIEMIKYFESKI